VIRIQNLINNPISIKIDLVLNFSYVLEIGPLGSAEVDDNVVRYGLDQLMPYKLSGVIDFDESLLVDGATGLQGPTGNQGVTGVRGLTGVQGQTGLGTTGAQGNQGATGLQGPTGYKGDTGSRGATGAQGLGVTGLVGTTGVQGIVGPQGATGLTGVTGHTGVTGVQGQTGAKGSTGSIGMQGQTGAQGETGVGIQGTTGVKGVTGTQGNQGYTGATGLQGLVGTQGATGSRGTTGVAGVKGTTGSAGVTGLAGGQGVTGVQGQTGVGTKGATGAIGATGSGLQGETGVQGQTGTSITGDQGATGVAGVIGETGVQGSTGLQGIQGVAGATGLVGPQGQTGAAGVAGSQGVTGLKGSTGLQGQTGLQGPNGLTGVAGATGEKGVTGVGTTGVQGITGLQGDQGQTGAAGVGVQGDVGSTGVQGQTGLQGNQGQTGIGATGVVGTTGPRGLTGAAGLQGSTGTQGIQGDVGYTGVQGQTGAAGSIGSTGVQGSQGATGFMGVTGVRGLTGLNGLNGVTGTKGTTGVPGQTGLQGLTGISIQGVTGLQGINGQTGIKGSTGVQGQTGAEGNTGLQGETGTGPQGETGLRGVTGPGVGVQGSTGVQGLQGATGVKGATGIGTQGLTGVQGAQGTTGVKGATGIDGVTGSQGETGVGVAGSQGATGVQGTQGATGAGGGGGANQQLSNLVPTIYNPSGGLSGIQINTNLMFATPANRLIPNTYKVQTNDDYFPIFGGYTGTHLKITSGTIIDSVGISGDLILGIGSANAGRGKIKIQDTSNGDGTTGVIGHVWTQTAADGSGAWQATGGGGVNTALSNLTAPTSINQDLTFEATPQIPYNSPSTTDHTITTATPTAPADLNSSHNLILKTGSSSFGSTGSVTIKTPQATNTGWGAGAVRSGNIILDVGISSNVPTITPGSLKIKDQSNAGGTTGVIGHVWTQTAADGSGAWQATPAAPLVKIATVSRAAAVVVGVGGGGYITYNEVSDPDNIFDNAQSRFVIPAGTVGTVKGVIKASFFMDSAFAVSDGNIAIRKNGTAIIQTGMFGVEGTTLAGAFNVEGVANDYFEVFFVPTAPAGTHTLGADVTRNFASFELFALSVGATYTKYTITHSDLQTAALTNNAILLTLPIQSIVETVMMKTTTAFAGTGITDYQLSIGITGNQTKYMPNFDCDAAVSGSNYSLTSVATGGDNFNATEAIRVYATATGANLDQSTAGSIDIWVKVATLP
jgi:hypothetical protein